MAKKGDDEGISLGTDAWNVADGFTKIKILRQMIMLDRWETIAQFGTEEVDEDRSYDENQIKKRRVEGLERFVATLKQLIGNTKFAMKKEDSELMKTFIERISAIEEYLENVYTVKEDPFDHTENFEINKELFKLIFKILQDIKDEINIPLNKAGLIFRPTEEIDLDKIMADIIEGG